MQNSSQSLEVQGVDRLNFIFAFDKNKCHFSKSGAHTHDRFILLLLFKFFMQLLVVFLMCTIWRLEISTSGYTASISNSKTRSSCLTPIFCLSLLHWPQADETLYCFRSGVLLKSSLLIKVEFSFPAVTQFIFFLSVLGSTQSEINAVGFSPCRDSSGDSNPQPISGLQSHFPLESTFLEPWPSRYKKSNIPSIAE